MTMNFQTLEKLKTGDTVAIVSPSFAAPAVFPEVYELGLSRIRDLFLLEPLAMPATSKRDATLEEKSLDLESAFRRSDIKAVIATIGGDIQVTYIYKMSPDIFRNNPKPFFGFSDNTHFCNFLWLNGIPSYYGGSVLCQFAMQGRMDSYTEQYLRNAFFDHGLIEITASPEFNDEGLDWADVSNLNRQRRYQPNEGWFWNGEESAEGILWGGCLESIDEILRHACPMPTLDQFSKIVLFVETSQEIPSADYVFGVLRALGERGILERIRGLLVGRPKAWEFGNERSDKEKAIYKEQQREAVSQAVRTYNKNIPIVQNLDFGHTDPQVCLPIGRRAVIDSKEKRLFMEF